ncbi:MAG TPA: PilZ domain-containing protein [Terriglobales bacterium]|nr:PilZ domain-containing protein [Terriglobales bacterium]
MATQSLVVSNDAEFLMALRPLLNEMGMGVEVCSSSPGAFRTIRDRKFDTVIVDCDDQDASGLDLLSTLRREQSNQKTVAVGVTSDYGSMKSVFDSGATFVLSKPLPVEDARRILRISKGVLTRAVRRFLRLPVENLATVTIGDHMEAIINNVSQGGIAIHAPTDLVAGQMVYASFLLPDTFDLMESMAQVMWVEPGGRAGLEFRSLTEDAQKQLRKWIVARAKAQNVIIVEGDACDLYEEEVVSDELLETVRFEEKLKLAGITALGAMVDFLVVAFGALLFLGIGFFFEDKPIMARQQWMIGLSAGIAFWLLYRFLFYFFNVHSPGEKAMHRVGKPGF